MGVGRTLHEYDFFFSEAKRLRANMETTLRERRVLNYRWETERCRFHFFFSCLLDRVHLNLIAVSFVL